MPRICQRATRTLNDEQQKQLTSISQSRNAALREVERARILLLYADGA